MKLLTYNQCQALVSKICDQIIADHKEYVYVYPLKYGGFVPAAMIAYRLNLMLIDQIRSPKTTLIVDDGIFTGNTIRFFRKNYGVDYDIAVLVAQIGGENSNLVSYCGKLVNDYVTFPWESLR